MPLGRSSASVDAALAPSRKSVELPCSPFRRGPLDGERHPRTLGRASASVDAGMSPRTMALGGFSRPTSGERRRHNMQPRGAVSPDPNPGRLHLKQQVTELAADLEKNSARRSLEWNRRWMQQADQRQAKSRIRFVEVVQEEDGKLSPLRQPHHQAHRSTSPQLRSTTAGTADANASDTADANANTGTVTRSPRPDRLCLCETGAVEAPGLMRKQVGLEADLAGSPVFSRLHTPPRIPPRIPPAAACCCRKHEEEGIPERS
jgi:hypothetical protein